MSRAPDLLDCKTARGRFIDAALGQASAAEAAAMRAHVAGCSACKVEVEALEKTLAQLRRPALMEPSARFSRRLDRALDGVDATRAPVRWIDEARFRMVLLGHQLRYSRRWQLRVAAALLPLLFGIGLVVRQRVHAASASEVASSSGAVPPAVSGELPTAPLLSAPTLVEWKPQYDPPIEPAHGAPVAVEELGPTEHEQATAALARLNEVDEAALARLRAVERDGGSAVATTVVDTRSPTRRALDWLVRNQRADGSFTPGDGTAGFECGVTGLALLALVSDGRLGAGTSEDPASPAGAVGADARSDEALEAAAARAVAWLFAQQVADGRFGGNRDPAIERSGHALATLALVERHLRVRATAPDAPAASAAVHDRLEQALSWLEVALDQTFHAPRERNAGVVAAWSALALATARHGGLEFHLKVSSDALCERMLAQLRSDPSEVLSAASQTVLAMAERDSKSTARDPDWARAVGSVATGLRHAEPALRFLVASALVADPRGIGREAWPTFSRALAVELLPQQAASGYFEAGVAWAGIGGGTAYETALAALALQVESRQRTHLAVKVALHRRSAARGGR